MPVRTEADPVVKKSFGHGSPGRTTSASVRSMCAIRVLARAILYNLVHVSCGGHGRLVTPRRVRWRSRRGIASFPPVAATGMGASEMIHAAILSSVGYQCPVPGRCHYTLTLLPILVVV